MISKRKTRSLKARMSHSLGSYFDSIVYKLSTRLQLLEIHHRCHNHELKTTVTGKTIYLYDASRTLYD